MKNLLDLHSLLSEVLDIDELVEVITLLNKYDLTKIINRELNNILIQETNAAYARISDRIKKDKEEFSIINKIEE